VAGDCRAVLGVLRGSYHRTLINAVAFIGYALLATHVSWLP
jgi:hypothetical protein